MTPADETLTDGTDGKRFPTAPLSTGDILADRYEIRGLLGLGGMGSVYEAHDRHLDIPLALKTLDRQDSLQDDALRLLKREVLLARQVSHPNVCRLHDLEWDQGRQLFFATMELLRGHTLSDRLDRDGPMAPTAALPLVEQMARGLEAAHEAGVVHRDFKCSNVMIVEGDRAVLTDFGIARPVRSDQTDATTTRHLQGTPAYMAPELWRGERAGPAADIYALGVVLHQMVTGRLPYAGGASEEIPSSPVVKSEDLPGSWEETIRRCLELNPGQRYESAELVVAALEGRGESAARERTARGSLPAERDAFVGRRNDLESLHQRLERNARLVSVLGIGGTGKTRLTLRFAHEYRNNWEGGTWFCDLSEARSVAGIASAMATTLDVPLGRDDPVVQLGHSISGRGRCLIVLDNFEQVARHAEETLGRWLDRCEDAQFLVTTQEVLGLPGEEAFPLNPMSREDGVDLFVRRAASVKPGFSPTDEEHQAIEELVELLDRLPLAIEIAASRSSLLSPQKILERAGDRFRLLTSGGQRRDRRATLKATLDWSWELLEEDEREALAQLSVFEGGFTVESAEDVLELERLWPVDALQSLVNKSLVRPGAGDRFDMLVSVQEYAAQRLKESGQREAAEVRHGAWYARYGDEEEIEALYTRGGVERWRRLERELDNLVAACRRAVGREDGAQAVAAYAAAWEVLQLRGPVEAALDLGRAVLRLGGLDGKQRARCLQARAFAARVAGKGEEAREQYAEALAIHREAGDRRGEGIVLGNLGIVHREQGRTEEARKHYEDALEVLREAGDRPREGVVLGNLGTLHRAQGKIEEVREQYEEALAISREVGFRRLEGHVLGNLGVLHWSQGNVEAAQEQYEEALAIAREVGDRRHEGTVLGNLGILHREQGRMEEARAHYGEALAIHREVGDLRFQGVVLGNLGNLHRMRGRMAEGRACFVEGEGLLREIRAIRELAELLCVRGRLDLEEGDLPAARSALDEAGRGAEETGAGSNSDLGRDIQTLREAIEKALADE